MVKNMPANAGDLRDACSIPGLGRSPEGGRGNPLQYYCHKDPFDRETWQNYSPECHKESDTTEAT